MKTVLLLVLSCFVVPGMCGSALAAEIAEPTVDPLDLLPGGLIGLGHVNLKQLANLGLIERLLEMDPRKTTDAIGLDPRTDLNALAVGIKAFGKEDTRFAVVVTGRFDTDAIYKQIRKEDLSVPTTYKGYKLLRREEDEGLHAVLDGKVFVIGSQAVAKKIIDVYKGDAKPAAKDSPLMRRAEALRGNTFWFVADLELPPIPPNAGMRMPGLDPSKIQELTISGKLTKKDLALKVIMSCKDEDSAAGMVGGLKQGINMMAGMANMETGGDADATKAMGELFKAIKIGGKDKAATIDLTVTAQLAEGLKAIGVWFVADEGPVDHIHDVEHDVDPPPVNLDNDTIDWDADDDW